MRKRRDIEAELLCWCKSEVNRIAGFEWWDDGQAAYLRASLRLDPKAPAAYRKVIEGLRAAREFLIANPEADDEYAQAMRSLFADHGSASALSHSPGVDEPPPVRTAIVLTHDKPDRWWWTHRPPATRDLALLSLLAGQRSDAAKRFLHRPKASQNLFQAECRAIGETRKRIHIATIKHRQHKLRAERT